jgi:hypothetical protein
MKKKETKTNKPDDSNVGGDACVDASVVPPMDELGADDNGGLMNLCWHIIGNCFTGGGCEGTLDDHNNFDNRDIVGGSGVDLPPEGCKKTQ